MAILSGDTRCKIKKWQKNNPEKMKQYRKKVIEKQHELQSIAQRDSYLSASESETVLRLKKCYITCYFRNNCLPKDCLECGKNIQRKRTIDDIEAVRR